MGYQVTGVAASGAEALALAERTVPDLVLMDIRIKGDMDGIDAARALRLRYHLPVVYLTAHADRDTLDRAKLAEPLGYIVKPFQENELRASIEIALHKRQMDLLASRKQESLSAALNLAGEGVITVDASGLITLMNAAAETWTGWPRMEAVGHGVSQVLQLKGDAPASSLVARAIRLGELCEIEEGEPADRPRRPRTARRRIGFPGSRSRRASHRRGGGVRGDQGRGGLVPPRRTATRKTHL